MQGKDAIINKIIEDAENNASEIINKATEIANKKVSDAEKWASDFSDAQNIQIEKNKKDILERKKIVANLDVRKILLKAKQETVEKAFSLALKKLQNVKKDIYLEFVNKLLVENAEFEDEIILSKDGIVSLEEIKALSVFKEMHLSVSNQRGNFVGGVVLIGKICDKDLSFESIINDKKEELNLAVVAKLFN